MKLNKISLVAALALGSMLLSSTAVLAQDNKDGGDKGGGRRGRGQFTVEQRLERMTTELKLTDEQKPKVKAVLEEQDKKMQGLRDLAQDERATKMREMREESNKKMKTILTADQYKQYEEMNQRRRNRGGGQGGQSDSKKESGTKKN